MTREHREWRALAGKTRTERAANELMSKLEKRNFAGFQIKREELGARRFEVERPFVSRREASIEVRKLRAAGFHGGVVRA